MAMALSLAARGQGTELTGGEHLDPGTGYAGPAVFRTEFVSYDVREYAEKDDLARNQYYKALEFSTVSAAGGGNAYRTEIDLPVSWLEREVFIQVQGLQGLYLYVNGRRAGYAEDASVPVQFDLSAYLTTGRNSIEVTPAAGTGAKLEENLDPGRFVFGAFLFSQPKLRIHDYVMRFEPDPESGRFGFLDILFTLANDYNYEETITVGYDIYSPQGKLLYYDFRQITLAGGTRDTLRFREPIWRANDNVWSVGNPVLHYGQLTVKRDTRMIEYIPYRIGYDMATLSEGKILRQGEAMGMAPVRYNAAATKNVTSGEVAALKKQGYNTLCPDYPQPMWFYGLCDELGLYVVEQANVNTSAGAGDRRIGGTPANDPAWLGSFEARMRAMYERTKNHTCILMHSLGNDAGNGYNMYHSYLMLKRLDPQATVIYNGAAGEWNSDMAPLGIAGR